MVRLVSRQMCRALVILWTVSGIAGTYRITYNGDAKPLLGPIWSFTSPFIVE